MLLPYEKNLANIVKNKKVLHAGCVGTRSSVGQPGNFRMHAFLAEHASFVYGIDIDEEGINHMQTKGYACAVADASTYTSEERYDVVLLLNFLQFVENPTRTVANMSCLLAAGGVVVVTVPNVFDTAEVLRNALKFNTPKNVTASGQALTGELSLFSAASLMRVLSAAQLSPVSVESIITKPMSKELPYKENVRRFVKNAPRYLCRSVGSALFAIAKK